MSQKELAQGSGLSENYISVRLRGDKPLNLNDIEAIATALDMTPMQLMTRGEEAVRREDEADKRGPLRTSEGSYTGEQTEGDDTLLRDSAHQRRRTENH